MKLVTLLFLLLYSLTVALTVSVRFPSVSLDRRQKLFWIGFVLGSARFIIGFSIAIMTSAFSSNDADVIQRNVETNVNGETIQKIWNEARCSECLEWISKNNFKRVNETFLLR